MTKKKSKWIIRILLFLGTIISLYFVPWPIVKAWIKPLPDNVQEQVDKAAVYGFDGIIVYVNKRESNLLFMLPATKTEKIKLQPTPMHYSKLPV